MKICFIITRSDTVGGAHIHVLDLASRAQADGNDVTVLVGGDGPYASLLRRHGLKVVSLSHLVRPIRPHVDVLAVFECLRALTRFNPDIVHTHSAKAGLIGRAAAKLAGKPVVFTAHGWSFTEGIAERSRRLATFIERHAARISDAIICVSEYDRRLALHLGVGNEALLTRIHNGVLDVPPEMRADHSGNGPVKIISVARLDAQKDHALLIDALATIKDIPWELELIGDGPLTESIRARAHSLGIGERILFAGLCNDVPVRLSNADLFVLASGFEGFPLSILEAMRANLPVIASDVGGVSESVVEGTTGFLVPKGDKDALADRLRLLITDPELRKRLGLQGRFFYEREFSFDIMYNRTFEIYQRVLERRGRA